MPDGTAGSPVGLPPRFESSRTSLHRIAAHVLGRRRYDVSGRFGLRASPGGFATPAFGEDTEVIRVDGVVLVRDSTRGSAYQTINGSSLSELAAFAGCDLSTDFSVGTDTPDIGDPDSPIALDPEACDIVASWFDIGSRILDLTIGALPVDSGPATVQLWPEHFDAGTNVAVGGGLRVNLGASPGDSFSAEPYLYVGPWSDDRPGDPAFWNAPFGAVIRRSELVSARDPVGLGKEFLQEGLGRLTG